MLQLDTVAQRIVYSCTEQFLEARYVEELPYLPPIWKAVTAPWESTQAPDRGDCLEVLYRIGLPFADSALQLVSPLVILVLTAVTRELQSRIVAPSSEAVSQATLAAAKALGASEAFAAELAASVGPELFRMWRSLEFVASVTPAAGAMTAPGGAWSGPCAVDWSDQWTPSAAKPSVQTDLFPRSEIANRFGDRRPAFVLFVNEFEDSFEVRPGAQRGANTSTALLTLEWNDLRPAHESLLYLFLRGFQDRLPITFDAIARRALRARRKERESGDSAVRRAKAELNSRLGEVLDEILVARKGKRRYELRGQFPYCWIRRGDGESRLSRESPR